MFSIIAIVESSSASLSSGVFVGEVDCTIFKILMESVSYFVDFFKSHECVAFLSSLYL